MSDWGITDGDFYVASEGGSDANAGTMAAPFQTIQKARDMAASGQKIVCSGQFKLEQTTGSGEAIIGDGWCEIDGVGIGGLSGPFAGAATVENFEIRNYYFPDNTTVGFNNCKIFDFTEMRGVASYSDTVFYSGNTASVSNGWAGNYYRCTFSNITFQSNGWAPAVLVDCIFDENCSTDINVNEAFLNTCDYNCYENGRTINGNTITAWKAANPLYDIHSIEPADAKLNGVSLRDFTLDVTSTCVGAGSVGNDIGARFAAFQINGLKAYADGTAGPNGNGAKDANLAVDGTTGEYTLSSGTSGTLTTDTLDLSTLDNPIGWIRLNANQNLRDDDQVDTTIGDPAMPDHLTIEMRHGASEALCLAASYQNYKFNAAATEDTVNTANGETGYDTTTEIAVSDTWFQFRITIHDN